MADLLRSGNKMLNMACPVCNNPIFQNSDGITFCPTCNRQVIIVDENANQDSGIKKNEIKNTKIKEKLHPNRHNELFGLIENVIRKKLKMIAIKLENETHLQMIETYTKILLNCLDVLNKITVLKDTQY